MNQVELDVDVKPNEVVTDSTANSLENIVELPPVIEKKKRGRKPKPKPENPEPRIPKKRGRKPKGGKIITASESKNIEEPYVIENVILHLKCNSNDFESVHENNIKTFEDDNALSFQVIEDFKESKGTTYEHIIKETDKLSHQSTSFDTVVAPIPPIVSQSCSHSIDNTEDSYKKISEKMVELQKNFYFNDNANNHAACFWCTYDFEHTSVHIPKYKMNDMYHVYGCFCSPECGVAYLMNEQLDPSVKSERYQLINFLYNRIYENSTGIKPAPNPHYTLDKFMGNMSIQEYRQMLHHDRLFIVVDKPMTRVVPEIYEENDVTGNQIEYLKSTTNFKIKRAINKTSSKSSFFSVK